MTFTTIVGEVLATLNLTSTEATARVGRAVNAWHRRVTSGIGMNTARRLSVTQACTLGVQTVTFEGITSIERVRDLSTGTLRTLDEVLYDEIRRTTPGTADPRKFAIVTKDATSVTIYLDAVPQDTRELTADGLGNTSTLSGSMEPVFPEDFHDILVLGALSDEYRKMDKRAPAKDTLEEAERRMGELRMYLAKTEGLRIRQNDRAVMSATGGGASGGSGGSDGSTSYAQTGLVTFMRAPGAPFAVQAGSAYVANLIAASINGQGALALLNTVGAAQIDNDAVTYAKMQNVSAAGRLLGRGGASGAGDVEELTPGTSLSLATTTLNVNPFDDQAVLAARIFV